MVEIARAVEELGGVLIVDEIYQGLVYDGAVTSAAGISDRVFIVNSFSKYQGMTGWRVGWVVQPAQYVAASERLVQNIFIAASTPAQHAALEAFTPAARAEFERRRQGFRERRDYLLAALAELGFSVPSAPRGAFYVYADCSRVAADSAAFAEALLEEAGVAIAPGLDFGRHLCERHVRLSYASSLANLREGVQRMRGFLARRPSDGLARGDARPARPAQASLSDPD
jgi:aspartate/methionine/tyrosine aminotransferase